MKKKIISGIIIVFLAMQLFQFHENKTGYISAQDITSTYHVPEPVLHILQRSCYDCHSNNTNYPWYTYIQPIGWWINHHIEEGKGGLNFSEFGRRNKEDQRETFKDIYKSIDDNWMPLESYLWIHHNAKLSAEEAALLLDWSYKNQDEALRKAE